MTIGLAFLKNNGAQRMRNYAPQPFLLDDGVLDVEADEKPDLWYERKREQWDAINTLESSPPADWPWCPLRFIDGKDSGRTVAWLQARTGHPLPVRLAEIGAAAMSDQGKQLRRDFETIERVVSLIVKPFPWDEVESFAIALQEKGYHFLPCQAEPSFSFEKMRRATANRTKEAMDQLERQALMRNSTIPTLVDGRLEPHMGAFNQHCDPVVGLIKTHYRTYLHPAGLRLLCELRPGERTPSIVLGSNLRVISWYLRLDGQGEMPDWGVVRMEVSRGFFENVVQRDFSYVDYLSHIVYTYRCLATSYSRAPVSIYPIQRVEESLGALFSSIDTLVQRFYRYTDL